MSEIDGPEPTVPASQAFLKAYTLLIWLHHRGFSHASVELFVDGTGLFRIPLETDVVGADVVIREFAEKVGDCEVWGEPCSCGQCLAPVCAVVAFEYALRS